MPDNAAEVYVCLAQLWPRYTKFRMTPPAFHNLWGRVGAGVATDQAIEALQAHAAEYPDETKPNWKLISQVLHRGDTRHKMNDVEILLNQMRRENPMISGMPADQATPCTVWDAFLSVQTYPITHDPRTRKRHEDPDGRRAKLANKTRRRWQAWAERCYQDAGEFVPAWLQE